MRNIQLLVLVAVIMCLNSLSAYAGISWLSDANGKVDLRESIVDNLNGTWTYNYTLVNINEVPVWEVILYLNDASPYNATPISDATHQHWAVGTIVFPASGDLAPPEGQLSCIYSWTAQDNYPDTVPNAISAGQAVNGFSFTSSTYDHSTKRFVYNVQYKWITEQGYSDTGYQMFTAGGMTTSVPEPSSLIAVGFPVLVLGLRRLRYLRK